MPRSVAMESPNPARRALPKNVGLLELIRAKRERDWKPSVEQLKKGFRGWHQRGYLPHFDAPGVTQFVTFQAFEASSPLRGAESRESGSGESRARMAVVQRPSSRQIRTPP